LSRHSRHLARALTIAGTSTERQRHGALITKGNRVLTVGVNASRNHPLVCSNPALEAGIHAEEAAMRALPSGIDTSRLTLYVARMGRNGRPALSKPCDRCMSQIKALGIREVIYT